MSYAGSQSVKQTNKPKKYDFTRREIGQFQCFKIQLQTIDFSTRLQGINPTNTVFYSPKPRAEVYCLQLNFKNLISKLAY